MEYITAPQPERLNHRAAEAVKLREALYYSADQRLKARKVDLIIDRLLDRQVVRGNTAFLTQEEVTLLANKASSLFIKEPICLDLPVQESIYIIGDLYGQHGKLVQIFEALGHPSEQRYLFLGNYINRGERSIELISLLLAYKILYPDNILMLRGNHECHYVSFHYGFSQECRKRFTQNLSQTVLNCLNCLPAAAIIGESIFCVHSGLIKDIPLAQVSNQKKLRAYLALQIDRPSTIVKNHVLSQLTWSEPLLDSRGWRKNPAGLGYLFGEDQVIDFCERFDFQQIIRSNDLIRNGYEFAVQGKLLTICSVPHLYRAFYNTGAVVHLCGRPGNRTMIGRIKLFHQETQLRSGRPNLFKLMVRDSLGGPAVDVGEYEPTEEHFDKKETNANDDASELTMLDAISCRSVSASIDYADLNSRESFEYFQSSLKNVSVAVNKRLSLKSVNDSICL
ncbi:Serine/threonine-protein phosphatase [Fasciola gigantica]|uniref:Serine/threonine-protein phosphatase n=1 Tax=Fasciola gigantica TaxID=46835 RepID=A0A504YLZ4_FASGI|nr:Serine/threonine-protein phosphatase [Fasciola gigantica]